ncbi:MAG: hypothetical protein ACOY3I_01070 [Verrucomicrobiota bacterium]
MIQALFIGFVVTYIVALWRLHGFAKIDSVPIYWGGKFAPHAFAATRAQSFPFVCALWMIFFGLIPFAIPYLKDMSVSWGYRLAESLPIAGMVMLLYFTISTIVLYRLCANQDIVNAIDNLPKPYVYFPQSDYASCLIATDDESKLVPLLQDPEVSIALSMTPFPGPVRELPTELVPAARKIIPTLQVMPLHPKIGLELSSYLQQLEETSTSQAEKALDATRAFDEFKVQIQSLENTIAELQKSNETLNNKLLSVRTRARGVSADFTKMSKQELDVERDRLMDTLRRLDDERRRKSGK